MVMKRGLDHVVVCVNDLDRAREHCEQLGFVTTPRAQHAWGTDNILVQLEGNFIELLEVSRPEKIQPPEPGHFSFGRFCQDFAGRSEGIAMLVFESQDATADAKEFDSRGIGGYANFHFERRAGLPDGQEVTVAFTLAFSGSPSLPHAMFFCCQQHAPQYFWKSEYQAHDNGAQVIDTVFITADDHESTVDYLEQLQETGSAVERATHTAVVTPRGEMAVYSRDAATRLPFAQAVAASPHRHFVGFGVTINDLDAQAARLQRHGIEFVREDGALWLGPKDGFGGVLRFSST